MMAANWHIMAIGAIVMAINWHYDGSQLAYNGSDRHSTGTFFGLDFAIKMPNFAIIKGKAHKKGRWHFCLLR